MLRHEWELTAKADELLSGAEKKIQYHTERLAFWEGRKATTLTQIRETGLQVDEGPLGLHSPGSASNDPYRGPRVTIDNTLSAHISACAAKVNWHRRMLSRYEAWREILKTQGGASFKLHHDDWIFFFGTLPESEDKIEV